MSELYKPVRIYNSNNNICLEMDKISYLIDRLKNSSVLHVGCTDFPITEERIRYGKLLHGHLTKNCTHVVGIDNSSEGIKLLENNGFDNVKQMDAEDLKLNEKFDFIYAGDVIEHMNNPGSFFNNAKSLLNDNGALIISVPNAYSFNVFKFILTGIEPTHKDHTYYFSVKTLTELCSRFDLLPVKLTFSVQPINPTVGYFYKKMRDILISFSKQLSPAFIMEFKNKKYIDQSIYYEWR